MSLIVLVEDNPHNARLASRLLRREGHEVRIAEDGEKGLTTILGCQPDLILVDLGLPDIDGQTVVAVLRQQDQLNHIPILIFTAYPEHTAYEMAQAYRCDGVILKPIDTRSFVGQVSAFLGVRRFE
jgi:two-component system cell cycle response regulator DivK